MESTPGLRSFREMLIDHLVYGVGKLHGVSRKILERGKPLCCWTTRYRLGGVRLGMPQRPNKIERVVRYAIDEKRAGLTGPTSNVKLFCLI